MIMGYFSRSFCRYRTVLVWCLLYAIFSLSFFINTCMAGNDVPLPSGVNLPKNWKSLPPEDLLPYLLNIPYRPDGFVGNDGKFTLAANPKASFDSPGLNCSGFVLEAVRLIRKDNIPLEKAIIDRNNDSFKDSLHGEDWDFGWDLIMNVTEGLPRRFIVPSGVIEDVNSTTAFSENGFVLKDDSIWVDILPRIKENSLYLLDFSKPIKKGKSTLTAHYHVGIMYKGQDGNIWFYQTTGKGKVSNRRNMSTKEGIDSFTKSFAVGTPKRLIILEADLEN